MNKKKQVANYIKNELNSYLEEYENQGISLELNKFDFKKREEFNSSLEEIKIKNVLDKAEYNQMMNSPLKNSWFVWTKQIWGKKSNSIEDDNDINIVDCLGDIEDFLK